MAETKSNAVRLGTQAPDFKLQDVVSGKMKSLAELKSKKGTVVMFICNHCPYVKHIQRELVHVAQQYQTKGISFIAINANDVENYPEDSPENMKQTALEFKYPFVYLFDESQRVAKAYDAACTPDFYIYDGDLKLAYHGQFDDARPKNSVSVTGKDLCQALDNLLSQKPVTKDQRPSIGCNIKWK
ncbi:MAG: thioredoxin family protein [Deltaproteobacteria bacterium]|nr:thioredoxin family protein [Deltaproteobacteria bacterium]